MDDLRKIQVSLLHIVHVFKDICERNGLHYFASDGTMLGLVRHQGFIPWDDDVDFCLPRSDYEKLPEILDKELDESMHYRYFKQMDGNAKDVQFGIRLYCSLAQIKSKVYGEEIIEDVSIDMMPLDGMPKNPVLNKIHQIRLLSIRAITRLSQIDDIRKNVKRPPLDMAIIKVGKLFRFDKHLNTKRWHLKLDQALKKYSYESSALVCNFWSEYRFNEMVPKCWYEPMEMKPFEDTELPCPAQPERVLESLYGDWRNPPPGGPVQKHPYVFLRATGAILDRINKEEAADRERKKK